MFKFKNKTNFIARNKTVTESKTKLASINFKNLTKEMADYCVARMKPYVEPKTERPIPNALDYIDFTRTLFQN
ncbi:Spectrin alpha chain [Papilio machaon]|uniref:Spectrin alpha chain n=1 Tax=Papilio machaon TaxID=76193 RepID=A0A194RDK3_PAPMA|nr:Spectrin alpha chain [Papilio machaon]